jgi:hypothetical protein
MKQTLLYFILIFFCLGSCKNGKEDNALSELLINETSDCILKSPSYISKQNDSVLLILDRFNLMELNMRTGNLKKIDLSPIKKDLYSIVSGLKFANNLTLSYDEQLELGLDQEIHLVSFDENSNQMLLNLSLFIQDSIDSYIATPVIFYMADDKISILYTNDSLNKFSPNIPLGNFTTYFSDDLILACTINYFKEDSLPNFVPSLLAYSKTEDNEFYLSKKIEFPFSANDNVLSPDENYSDYPYMSKFSFFEYNDKLFISPGTSIYILHEDKKVEQVLNTKNRIVTFTIKNDSISTIEKNDEKTYSWHCYNLNTKEELTSTKKLPIETNIYACSFIEDTLFLIYNKEEKFYLLTLKN